MIEGPHVKAFRERQEAEHFQGLREALRQPLVRSVLGHIIGDARYCGADRSVIEAATRPDGTIDKDRVLYLEGMRDVGVLLRGVLQKVDFELYWRMNGEMANESRAFQTAQRSDYDESKKEK